MYEDLGGGEEETALRNKNKNSVRRTVPHRLYFDRSFAKIFSCFYPRKVSSTIQLFSFFPRAQVCGVRPSYSHIMRSMLLHLAESGRAKFSYSWDGELCVHPRPKCAVYVLAISIPCGVYYCIWQRVWEPSFRTLWVVGSAFNQGHRVQYMS